jgi:hypothetical protein
MIAIMTNVLAPAGSSGRAEARQKGISLEQLGLFTAIILRWPRLIGDLIEDPQLLARLASNEGGTNGTGDYKPSGREYEEKLADAVDLGGLLSHRNGSEALVDDYAGTRAASEMYLPDQLGPGFFQLSRAVLSTPKLVRLSVFRDGPLRPLPVPERGLLRVKRK